MSRIGNAPVVITEGVTVEVTGTTVTVKGKLGELTQEVSDNISINIDESTLTVTRNNESKDAKAQHGLYRSLIANMIEGVSKGFEVKQEMIGVGFRAKATGQDLEMNLGFSHNVMFRLPAEVKLVAEQSKGSAPIVTLSSCDKQLLGQVAAKLRSLRKPEPYKGKGIKFVGEQIRRKAGKSASK